MSGTARLNEVEIAIDLIAQHLAGLEAPTPEVSVPCPRIDIDTFSFREIGEQLATLEAAVATMPYATDVTVSDAINEGDHYEYILHCLYEMCTLPPDLLSAAMYIGQPIAQAIRDAIRDTDTLGEPMTIDLTSRVHGAAVEAGVLAWLPGAPQRERVHMAYAGLLTTNMQISEVVIDIANTLAQAHVETLGLERPHAFHAPLRAPLNDFRISDAALVASEENMATVLAQPRYERWSRGLEQQYQRMCTMLPEMTFREYVQAVRDDHQSRQPAPPPPVHSSLTISTTSLGTLTSVNNSNIATPRTTVTCTSPNIAWTSTTIGSSAAQTRTSVSSTILATANFTVPTTSMWMQTSTTTSNALPPNWARSTSASSGPVAPKRPTYKQRRHKRHETKRARRALVKSMDLYRKFRGNEEIRTFIKGDTVTITGHLYDYAVARKPHVGMVEQVIMSRNGIIPYRLTIMSKDGKELAGGCVYFADTPILDQIIILALHVQDREEEIGLIKKTVWSSKGAAMREERHLNEIIENARTNDIGPPPSGFWPDFSGFFAQGADWTQRWTTISRRIRPTVEAYVLSRLAIPAVVRDFMAHPSFTPTDLLTSHDTSMFQTTMEMIEIASGVDRNPAMTNALVSALSGVPESLLAQAGT